MNGMKPEPITCPACNEESFLKRTAKYDGFIKTGATLSCAACGHEFDGETQVPFRERLAPKVFDSSERPHAPEIFRSEEIGCCCRYCEQYVVNPFVQRCALHGRAVEATDTCGDFARKQDPDATDV